LRIQHECRRLGSGDGGCRLDGGANRCRRLDLTRTRGGFTWLAHITGGGRHCDALAFGRAIRVAPERALLVLGGGDGVRHRAMGVVRGLAFGVDRPLDAAAFEEARSDHETRLEHARRRTGLRGSRRLLRAVRLRGTPKRFLMSWRRLSRRTLGRIGRQSGKVSRGLQHRVGRWRERERAAARLGCEGSHGRLRRCELGAR
jgi:hypothetical protein